MNYYNEIDRFAASWLRNLIAAGHIAPGEVDERDIREVTPGDLRGFTQCHFFAGIDVWSYALRLSGWPDDRPVWTGSCPCQPFSAAGKRSGTTDERHLWPDWCCLIRECRPPVIFGEQVASPDALRWFDLVSTDLEGAGYAVGAADLCAAGCGAPHIRQRLYFVADSISSGRQPISNGSRSFGAGMESPRKGFQSSFFGDDALLLGNPCGAGLARRSRQSGDHGAEQPAAERTDGAVGGLAYTNDPKWGTDAPRGDNSNRQNSQWPEGSSDAQGCSPIGGFWAGADWLPCRDGKYRPVEPGTFPLAHGAPAHVGRLRVTVTVSSPRSQRSSSKPTEKSRGNKE